MNDLNTDGSRDTLYEELMAKEKERIDLLNRMVKLGGDEIALHSLIYNHKLIDVVISCANAWKNMFEDVVTFKNYDMISVFYENDRKIYSGVLICLIAILLYFMDISN
jgi:hypothetical protein